MKRLSITIVVLFMVFTMACNRSPETSKRENLGSNAATAQSVPAQTQSSEPAPVFEENPPEAMPPYAIPQPSTTVGMNPPHGQPGHRCDIAVGVPLDSPPGTGKQPTPSLSSQAGVPVQTSTPPTAPGMNPPHGQPNHRCDIPVGAPLDSPPGTKPIAPTVSGQNMPLQTTTMPIPAATTPTAPGMNPPHGQPNHRCDIPVGAPLDSPPAESK